MILHDLKFSFRILKKDKINSLINILGLSIGMAAVLLISIYVQHELSYDKQHVKHDRIYRLLTKFGPEEEVLPNCMRLRNHDFTQNLPEVEAISQYCFISGIKVKVEDQQFEGIQSACVDTNFNEIFTFKVLSALDPERLFTSPKSIVLTRSIAEKIFHTTAVAGKEIKSMGMNLTVSSVIEDLSVTSHFTFEALIPLNITKRMDDLGSIDYYSYILLKSGVNKEEALDKVNRFYEKRFLETYGDDISQIGSLTQELTDIHLNSDYSTYLTSSGRIKSIYVQMILAVIILLIAVINFINILLVQYDSRLNETGVQKALGATRFSVMKRIFSQTMLMVLFAILLAVILSEILLPVFSHLVSRNLSIHYLNNPLLYLGIPALVILVGGLSGLYPSLMISKFSPANLIKGITKSNLKTNRLSQFLLVFQFAVSILFIASVLVMQMQIRFMKKSDLGFQPDQVIAVSNFSPKHAQSYDAIKQELLKNPFIENISESSHLPGFNHSLHSLQLVNEKEEEPKLLNLYSVAPGYFSLLDIKFIAGSSFQEFNKADERSLIINEKAMELFEIKETVGKKFLYNDTLYSLKGVVKNFHYESMTEEIKPLVFTYSKSVNFILIKTKHQQFASLFDEIRKVFAQFDDGKTIHFKLVGDICRERYEEEEKEEAIIISSSLLSIFLSLLGLYAITLFTIQKRTKEIGVRKVLGASVLQILQLLFNTYAKWLCIAYVIAIPCIWVLMNKWLENFAYKVSMGIFPFLAAGFLTFLFALLTVVFQTRKAAKQNPIEALRYE